MLINGYPITAYACHCSHQQQQQQIMPMELLHFSPATHSPFASVRGDNFY